MKQLHLIRHAESTFNAERRWAGWADPDLSENGIARVRSAQAPWRRLVFDAIGSSPLKRARRTAELIADESSARLLDPIEELAERDLGDWSGLTSMEIEALHPETLAQYRSGRPTEVPGGEPWRPFVERVRSGIGRCAGLGLESLIVVVHLGVLRAVAHAVAPERAPSGPLPSLALLTLHFDESGNPALE